VYIILYASLLLRWAGQNNNEIKNAAGKFLNIDLAAFENVYTPCLKKTVPVLFFE